MASSDATQRAVLAGLSCGIGLAAPVVMYAATLPFSSVNETVVAGAVPFAVGAVAGVGIYAASLGISEYRAQHAERLFQPDAMGGAANVNQHQDEFQTASMPAQQQWATPQGVAAAAPAVQANAAQPSSVFSGLTGAFQRRRADDGVPTIARAADAMSEADAWSMIDSMLDDDSPVSCDPTRSRDVYQVAIDELTYGGQTGSINRDDIAAAARAVSGSHAAPAGSTAAFVALVANAANNAATAQSVKYDTAVPVTPAAATAVDPYADEPLAVDEETIAARRAAESSLWGAPAQQQAAEAVPYNANLANMPIISDASAAAIDLDDLDEPVISNDMPYVVAAPVDAPASASQSVAVDEPVDATPRKTSPWPITRATRACGPPLPQFWTRSSSLLPLPLRCLRLLLSPLPPLTSVAIAPCSPRIPPASRAKVLSVPRPSLLASWRTVVTSASIRFSRRRSTACSLQR